MAITAVIGPVAVVHECLNSQLFQNPEATLTIRQLLQEISSIIRAFPEVSRYPALAEGFGARRLKTLTYSALSKSGRNRAPMLQDVMKGKETNIDFSTGYFLRRGRELGISCPRLDMITTMVKAKERIKRQEIDGDIPFPWQQS
jgi:2-dehydropantoate 2-reductase